MTLAPQRDETKAHRRVLRRRVRVAARAHARRQHGHGPRSDYILADISLRICVQREKMNEVDAEP
jgi:hypothetical protein